jgi:hypothetical protein
MSISENASRSSFRALPQSRGVRSGQTLALVFAVLLSVGTALADDARTNFNIPAQPMAEALYAFSAITGIEILVDARSAEGRRSTAVAGTMAPREALEVMLAGSGLASEDFGPGTIALKPIPRPPADGSSGSAARLDLPYFADVQRAIQQALCADARTLPGTYRVALKLWIGRSGTVLLSKRLDTTGDAARDVAIDAVMHGGLRIGQPPADLPQPITLLISPRDPQETSVCSSRLPELRRASNR